MHCELSTGCRVAELTGNSTQAIKDFEHIDCIQLTSEIAMKYLVSLDFVTNCKQCPLSGNDEQGVTDAISVWPSWLLGLGAYPRRREKEHKRLRGQKYNCLYPSLNTWDLIPRERC